MSDWPGNWKQSFGGLRTWKRINQDERRSHESHYHDLSEYAEGDDE